MLTFEPGDIAVVPFPYTDRLSEKRRPALVVSRPDLQLRHGLVWLVMITSADNQHWPDDIILPLAGSGLKSPSVIRPAKIATVDASRILRVAGNTTAPTLAAVRARLQDLSF